MPFVRGSFSSKNSSVAAQDDAVLAQILGDKTIRQRLAAVPVNEREHTAARPARGDALEPPRGDFAEAGGEIRHDKEVILFRHAAGPRVVVGDRRVFAAEIHLDHFLDVLVQLGEPLLDLVCLRPDAAVDEAFLVIGKMHQAGEILPERHRIHDGKSDLPRRHRGEHAEHEIIQNVRGGGRGRLPGFKQQRSLVRKSQRDWQRKFFRRICRTERKPRIAGHRIRELRGVHVKPREFRVSRRGCGRLPHFHHLGAPRRKASGGFSFERGDFVEDCLHCLVPG